MTTTSNNLKCIKETLQREHFTLDLIGIDWDEHLKINKQDVNYSLGQFLSILEAVLDRYALIKKKNQKKINRTWITNGIIKSINIKNKMHQKFFLYELFTQYKSYTNLISNLLRTIKTNYYKSYFQQFKHNIKKTWG